MAAKRKNSQEKRCRNNIATILDLIGFQDDHPNITTQLLLQKLSHIKEKQSTTTAIKHSRIRRITFKFDGKLSVIQEDPTTVLESLHSDDNVGNTQVMIAEKDSRKNLPELENPNLDDQMVMSEDEGDHGIIEKRVNDGVGVGEVLRDFIRNVGGSSESTVLVVEKRLTKTDVNSKQGRLLMPILPDKFQDFLTAKEKEKLGGEEDMKVWVFDPKFRKSTLNLRFWKMKQQYLVLKTHWNQVVAANKLKENMVLKVWSFRVDEQLCFALVRVDDDDDGGDV
ncbi:hypothetical protein L6452_25528 [Arctium lappa]|nr:hypothetical protein L6452_25528 [Arctium lappa]